MTNTVALGLRAAFYEQLHCRYQRHEFDNWLVWGGNETIEIDGRSYGPTLARAYIEPGATAATARVRCELFVAEIDCSQVRAGDVDARLWTDADGTESYVPMHLLTDAAGAPVLADDNLVFASDAFELERTGAFNYTVEFSADSHVDVGRKEWISLNDFAKNDDGLVVVSPRWVRGGPVIAEVCARKVGARVEGGALPFGDIRRADRSARRDSGRRGLPAAFFSPGLHGSAFWRGCAQGRAGQRLRSTRFFSDRSRAGVAGRRSRLGGAGRAGAGAIRRGRRSRCVGRVVGRRGRGLARARGAGTARWSRRTSGPDPASARAGQEGDLRPGADAEQPRLPVDRGASRMVFTRREWRAAHSPDRVAGLLRRGALRPGLQPTAAGILTGNRALLD